VPKTCLNVDDSVAAAVEATADIVAAGLVAPSAGLGLAGGPELGGWQG
jgi:hypothetical protein